MMPTKNTLTFPLEWRAIMSDTEILFLSALVDNLPFSIKDDEFSKILKCSLRSINRAKKILSKELKILEYIVEFTDFLKETTYIAIDYPRINSLLKKEDA